MEAERNKQITSNGATIHSHYDQLSIMKLNLRNPLVFFDLETTGLDIINDRIVEISLLKIEPNGIQTAKTMRLNPEKPISPEATAVHGITDADVKDCPTFRTVARSIAQEIEGCDLAGYNSNRFDIPLLAEEFLRADIDVDLKRHKFVDVQVIYHKLEPRTLSAAYNFYCDKSLMNAHSAAGDTMATYEVLQAQLDHYPQLPNDINALSDFTSRNRNLDFAGRIVLNDNDVPVFNFGKHMHKSVVEVLEKEPSYYAWMMQNDFPRYTKKVLTAIRLQMGKNNK